MGEATPAFTGTASRVHVADERLGGRFWMLAESGDEEGDIADGSVAARPEVNSATPSDFTCETFQVGYSEEDVAGLVDAVIPESDSARLGVRASDKIEVARQMVHQRTTTTAIRPW
ncbi:hypothetical protein D1007_00321 [Hordeum vulgare]|nr:hypothetical protein D1007_00321 [Hordeum vulgare]